MIDKEKAYNTVALKYYELQELEEVRSNLLSMNKDYNAEVKIKTIHEKKFNREIFTKKSKFLIAPELLIQVIDELIENKKEYLDKAIDLTIASEDVREER